MICPLVRLMSRSFPGQGRQVILSEDLSNPERSTSNLLCPFLKLYRHKSSSTQDYCSQKEIRRKIRFLPPAVCLLYAFDSALYCGGYFSLLVCSWWVNREEAEPRMYNLENLDEKKKRADYEKNEHFLNWFQKKSNATQTPVIPFV